MRPVKPQDHPYKIHQQVRKYREEQELSQAQLAEEAVISLSTLVKIESGANDNPRIDTLFKIASILEVGVDDLLGVWSKSTNIKQKPRW